MLTGVFAKTVLGSMFSDHSLSSRSFCPGEKEMTDVRGELFSNACIEENRVHFIYKL